MCTDGESTFGFSSSAPWWSTWNRRAASLWVPCVSPLSRCLTPCPPSAPCRCTVPTPLESSLCNQHPEVWAAFEHANTWCIFLFKKSVLYFSPIGLFNSALQWSFDHLQAAGCSAMATCSPIHHFPAAALPKTQRYGLLLVCIIMAYKCDEASLTTQEWFIQDRLLQWTLTWWSFVWLRWNLLVSKEISPWLHVCWACATSHQWANLKVRTWCKASGSCH